MLQKPKIREVYFRKDKNDTSSSLVLMCKCKQWCKNMQRKAAKKSYLEHTWRQDRNMEPSSTYSPHTVSSQEGPTLQWEQVTIPLCPIMRQYPTGNFLMRNTSTFAFKIGWD